MASDGSASSGDFSIGCQITLTTSFGEVISGTVFAYEKATNCLLLKQPGSHGGVSTLRLLRRNFISQINEALPPTEKVDLTLPVVDLNRGKLREKLAVEQAEADAARVGEGVTREAQSVFDAIHRTMPCKWSGKAILVMDEVTIPPPYTPAACAADNSHSSLLDRVRKVLTAERLRLGFDAPA